MATQDHRAIILARTHSEDIRATVGVATAAVTGAATVVTEDSEVTEGCSPTWGTVVAITTVIATSATATTPARIRPDLRAPAWLAVIGDIIERHPLPA